MHRDREGPNKWPIEWNDNRYTVNRIEWVAEMFGYVIAASHLGLFVGVARSLLFYVLIWSPKCSGMFLPPSTLVSLVLLLWFV